MVTECMEMPVGEFCTATDDRKVALVSMFFIIDALSVTTYPSINIYKGDAVEAHCCVNI